MDKVQGRIKSSSPLNKIRDPNASLMSFSIPKMLESTLSRLSSFNTKKIEKLESQRKEKLIQEIRSLQDRPHISETSKKIFKNYVPLYKRLDEVVKSKHEYIRNLQIESQLEKKSNFKSNCTFQPAPSNISSRTPAEFVEFTLNWEARKKQKQEFMKMSKEREEDSEITLRPEISQKSLMLSSNRSSTPVFERLYEVKCAGTPTYHEFKPTVSKESLKIVEGKREGKVHERLYAMSKLKPPEAESHKKVIKKNKSQLLLRDTSSYKINSCEGTVFESPFSLANNTTFLNSLHLNP